MPNTTTPLPPRDIYTYDVIDGVNDESLFHYEGFRRYTPEISRQCPFIAVVTTDWDTTEVWALRDDTAKTIAELQRYYKECEEQVSSFRVLS